MKRFHQKSPLFFALTLIGIYVAGASITDALSAAIGVEKALTLPFFAAFSLILLLFLKKEGLFAEYGLCKPAYPARRFLFYLPLLPALSCNLWFGVTLNYTPLESVLHLLSMLLVGFLEELIVRGFLFRAMAQKGVKSAMIVSSLSFGIGHMVNLINGSGATLIENLCQVLGACAFGLLFVYLFYKGKSLLVCIAAHSIINGLSVFAVSPTSGGVIASGIAMTLFALGYTLLLTKTLKSASSQ
ncbi:MAG: CPBP family intramembrane metalloprotease [Clostridia bacterium]|nr:CPBP family intramembrane metalloprotease [Clostridia bacterium]